jgi:hypothetical protein
VRDIVDNSLKSMLSGKQHEINMELDKKATVLEMERMDEKKADKIESEELRLKLNRLEALVSQIDIDDGGSGGQDDDSGIEVDNESDEPDSEEIHDEIVDLADVK